MTDDKTITLASLAAEPGRQSKTENFGEADDLTGRQLFYTETTKTPAAGTPVQVVANLPPVTRTPGVCGGEACVPGTRIPVWLLVTVRRRFGRETLSDWYPHVSQDRLDAALRWADDHPVEIDAAIERVVTWNARRATCRSGTAAE